MHTGAATTGMSAREVLTTTRAVRRRLDLGRTVPRAVVDDAAALAAQAPTGQNRSFLRWLFIDDPARRAAAAAVYRAALADTLATRVVRDDHERRLYASVDHLGEVIGDVPVLALPYTKTAPPLAPESYVLTYWMSTVPAVWSFQLALRAAGLGSTLTTVHVARAAEMADAVGLPPAYTQLGLLPIAATIGDDFRPARRPSIDQLRRWNDVG